MNFETIIGLEVHVELKQILKFFHLHQRILERIQMLIRISLTGHFQVSCLL